jgi:sortase A
VLAGVVLMVAGVSLLAYVGWQLYGTTWVAEREQRQVVEATTRVWRDDDVDGDAGAVEDADSRLADDVVALVRIPALGSDYVVPAHAGTDDETLTRGFGIFDGAEPGAKGNFAIAGHRITHGEPLRRMPELRPGDEVVVETRDRVYTYVLDTGGADLTLDIDDGWVTAADPVDPTSGRAVSDTVGDGRLLTLVTCAELFHSDTRLVAFGHLTSVRRA